MNNLERLAELIGIYVKTRSFGGDPTTALLAVFRNIANLVRSRSKEQRL